MKQLVCLSASTWTSTPTRTQQLLTRLKDVEILYFEPNRGGVRREQGRKVRPNIAVYTMPAPPARLFAKRAAHRLGRFFDKTLEKHRFRQPALWVDSPEYYALVGQLPYSCLIYDCDREWDEYPLEWESELALRADVAFAASADLKKRLSPCCDNIALIPNGVNYPMFTRDDWETPAPLRRKDKPILIRVGAVTAELDLEPLLQAGNARPEWTFVLVGEVEESVRPVLERLHNVVLTGQVPMVDVPDYLGSSQLSFDLLSRATRGSDILPIRLYEYLAVGNPVVMMLEPEQVEPFPDVVYTANTTAGFLRRCENALAEDPTWVRSRRRAYAEEAQWANRAREIQNILEDTMLL